MIAQPVRVIAERIQGRALRPTGVFPFRLRRQAIAATTDNSDVGPIDPIERGTRPYGMRPMPLWRRFRG